MSCKCKICLGHKKTESIIKSRDIDKLIEHIKKLEDENLNLGFDLDYYLGPFSKNLGQAL